MRRTIAAVAAAVALALVATLPTGATSYAEDGSRPAPPAPAERDVLDRAVAALAGEQAGPRRPEATLALRDLFVALPRLGGAERRRAERLLARPTNKRGPWIEPKYTTRSTKQCNRRLCVHRVRRTSHRASSRWATRTLRTLDHVWQQEIGELGYRRPLRDGRRGGDNRFDVYLADVGAEGLYGYCAAEYTQPGNRRLASGYCVLDNDFARSQYGGRPIDNLRATAAHEFFHAIQFAYDYREDPWLMETTSTWMEERVYDGVDDNRQYLPHGQVVRNRVPLDHFEEGGLGHYGNWAFFEYVGNRYGSRVVRRTWEQAGHQEGGGRKYSTRALQAALPRRASFTKAYAGFTAANVLPARSYPEGEHWPSTRPRYVETLGSRGRLTESVRLDHMSSELIRVTPADALDRRRWRLRIRVDAPHRRTGPAVSVVRQRVDGTLDRTTVRLGKGGNGSTTVPFSTVHTRRVWVVPTNASTRFDCRGRYVLGYSCGGRSRDDDRDYRLDLQTYRRSG